MLVKFEVRVPHLARKSLNKISLPWRERINLALNGLETNPFAGEKMWGKLTGKYKIKIWPYRIIYKVNEKTTVVGIVNIGHRGDSGAIGYK